MKKFAIAVFTFVFILSVSAMPLYALTGNGGVSTLGTCPNHDFSTFGGYSSSQNQHTYRCPNPGCTSYIVEECYNRSPCCMHQDVETLECQRCSKGKVNIHNYEYQHGTYDSQQRHILTCTNSFPEFQVSQCSKTSGDYINCTLLQRQIWRGFMANKGHYLTQTCSECDNQYNVGYHYPNNHPNYFNANNDCEYCKMTAPYHKDW